MNERDRIAVMFCGTHKTLAFGIPLIKVNVNEQSVGGTVLSHTLHLKVLSGIRFPEAEQSEKSGQPSIVREVRIRYFFNPGLLAWWLLLLWGDSPKVPKCTRNIS